MRHLPTRTFDFSKRLCNLSALAQPCFRILVFFPAHGVHWIASFTRGHDDTQIVGRS